MKVVFLFNASNAVGLGHFSRALSLSRSLAAHQIPCDLIHLGELNFDEMERLQKFSQSYEQEFLISKTPDDLQHFFKKNKFTHVLVDVSENFNHERWDLKIFKNKQKIISFDDLTEFRKVADVCFYPPLDYIKELDWNGFDGKIFSGFEYYIFRPELQLMEQYVEPIYDVCIACGGSDPNSLTLDIFNVMEKFTEFKILVILGPLAKNIELPVRYNVEILYSPLDYLNKIKESKVVISTYGVSTFEIFFLNIKNIVICLNEDHVRSAKVFEKEKNITFIDRYTLNQKLLTNINRLLSAGNTNRRRLDFEINKAIISNL